MTISYDAFGVPTYTQGSFHSYCANNPIMYADTSGHSLITIFAILAFTTLLDTIFGGGIPYSNGATGWALY